MPPKSGWRTSEFCLSLAAKLLGAAFAAGLIADGSTLARICGLAAAVLTSVGYSVSRGMAKSADTGVATPLAPATSYALDNFPAPAKSAAPPTAAAGGFALLQLVVVLAALAGLAVTALAGLSGCGARMHAAEHAFIDCEEAAVKAKESQLEPTVTTILSNGSNDWREQLEALVAYAGEETIACAVKASSAMFASRLAAPKPPESPDSGGPDDDGAYHRASDTIASRGWSFTSTSNP